ncbi:MAG TPA: hypothetical protein VHN11_15985, partial [Xanthobacteraceae bacterium]|nr:hypothetical protein [Xanthobacteraceae bacterium]
MGTVEKILLDDELSPRYWFMTGVPVNDAPVATPTRLEGGWLRLVDHQAMQHAFVQSGKSFSSNKFDIKFSLIWQKDAAGTGESGGGFCLALADADELAGVGSYGESGDNLGYRGLKGSFIGIGFSVGANGGCLYDYSDPLGKLPLTPLIALRHGEKQKFKPSGFFKLYETWNAQGERVALNLPISREHPLGLEFPFEINVFPSRKSYDTTKFHEFQIVLNGYLVGSREFDAVLPKKMKLVLTATT